LCEAPSGPLRQVGPVPFFLLRRLQVRKITAAPERTELRDRES